MNAIATEDNEKTNIGAKLESAIEKTKGTCERLEEKTVAAAKTADKAVRTPPYQALGIAFGVGLFGGRACAQEPAPPSKARTVDLEIIAVSVFAMFCFVALAVCNYVIFAKCEGKWPF